MSGVEVLLDLVRGWLSAVLPHHRRGTNATRDRWQNVPAVWPDDFVQKNDPDFWEWRTGGGRIPYCNRNGANRKRALISYTWDTWLQTVKMGASPSYVYVQGDCQVWWIFQGAIGDSQINMATRRKLLEACVWSTLLYATQAWYPNSREINELEVCWYGCLRRMVKGGLSRKRDQNTGEQLFSYTYSNLDLESIIKTPPIRQFIIVQYLHYVAHICRGENTLPTKKMLFAKSNKAYFQDPWIHISNLLLVDIYQAKSATQDRV